jgi:hypothetical protein
VLIDDALPRFDAVERHSTLVRAPRRRVYAALHTADLGGASLIRLLLWLRSLPGRRRAPARAADPARARPPFTLSVLLEHGFVLLADVPDEEVVVGAVGRFWTAKGERYSIDAARFRDFDRPGTAIAAWNFSLSDAGADMTRVSTETRVRCTDAGSRRRFRAYWLVVRPFSGLIRRLMLRQLRLAVERG